MHSKSCFLCNPRENEISQTLYEIVLALEFLFTVHDEDLSKIQFFKNI